MRNDSRGYKLMQMHYEHIIIVDDVEKYRSNKPPIRKEVCSKYNVDFQGKFYLRKSPAIVYKFVRRTEGSGGKA